MISIEGVSSDMIANNLIPGAPSHPGEILEEEMECRGISVEMLASETGLSSQYLYDLIKGRENLTIEDAMILEAALGIDADFWINLQSNFTKSKARHDSSFMDRLANIRRIVAAF